MLHSETSSKLFTKTFLIRALNEIVKMLKMRENPEVYHVSVVQ